MKNIIAMTITLMMIASFTTQLLCATKNNISNTKQSGKNKKKTQKPVYYQGHSFGLQNYPGKTIDAGANTGMLPTNSSSPLMGNDITF